jgi:hypothetical protein
MCEVCNRVEKIRPLAVHYKIDDAPMVNLIDAVKQSPPSKQTMDAALLAILEVRNAMASDVGEPRGGSSPVELDDDAALSPAGIAKKFDLPIGALRSRLKRFRQEHPDGGGKLWIENSEAKSREPKYLHFLRPIQSIIESIKSTSTRPAK